MAPISESGTNGNALLEAIRYGDDRLLRKTLAKGESRHINEQDSDRKTALHWAVSRGDHDMVKLLIEYGANESLWMQDSEGKTALHLAVAKNDVSIAKFLLESGADFYIDEPDVGGSKPLYISAEKGLKDMVSLLLKYGADIDSYNFETGRTALHQAIGEGHLNVATILLNNGANNDALTSKGHTPLMEAVFKDNLDAVKLLLKHGSKKKLRSPEGFTAEDFAIMHAPRILHELRAPAPGNKKEPKDYACLGFEATIVDFFKADNNKVPSPNFATTSIYDLLYCRGPTAIMKSAESDSGENTTKSRSFRWFHFPANNMEWVELLIDRIIKEGDIDKCVFTKEWKERLALTNGSRRKFCTSTVHSGSSFMRHMCQTFENSADLSKDDDSNDDDSNDDEPGDRKVKKDMSKQDVAQKSPKHLVAFVSLKQVFLISQANKTHIPFLGFEMYDRYQKIAEVILETQEKDSNQECITSSDIQNDGTLLEYIARSKLKGISSLRTLFAKLAKDRYLHPTVEKDIETFPEDINHPVDLETGLGTKSQSSSDDEYLIKGYLKRSANTPNMPPPLQLRRTLDQYFYTDAETIKRRNSDQVVYRYTQNNHNGPKMFMVDQLWLWIINEEIIITCYPQGWDSLDREISGQTGKSKEKKCDDDWKHPSSVSEMLLKQLRRDLKSSTSKKAITVHYLARLITNCCANIFDPFEVPRNFQFFDFFESSIGKVRISESDCFNRFYKTLEAGHAHSSSKPTHATTSDDMAQKPFGILEETKSLVDIKDILDELHIIEMVLTDQRNVLKILDQFTPKGIEGHGKDWNDHHRVLVDHISRVKQMEKLADDTHTSVSNNFETQRSIFSIATSDV
ncbi:hypothetical protein NHQ30_009888 [Ciborinia camelliae]|nr:hypothetical protein NHQ30_009888 [Ciborinia camelliae]